MRIEFQPAYVLHTRPYRDTSLLVDFFTPDYGRVGAVARGARQRKGGKRSLLNPFKGLLISLQGKSALKLLTGVESHGQACPLMGAQVYSGFYLNELIVRLLLEMDPHPYLYSIYQRSLQALQSGQDIEPILRNFEFTLFEELGYAINFEYEAYSDKPLMADSYYRYEAQEGFVRELLRDENRPGNVFGGAELQAMAVRDFSAPETRRAAKFLTRLVLQPLLGAKPLHSRALFLGQVST